MYFQQWGQYYIHKHNKGIDKLASIGEIWCKTNKVIERYDHFQGQTKSMHMKVGKTIVDKHDNLAHNKFVAPANVDVDACNWVRVFLDESLWRNNDVLIFCAGVDRVTR
jgi:hypothetical protein